ncbi:mechanosensitive ion channel domain-containing protein [Thalassospira australica]|uniref:mechanosensitive ion channel domain-containing protein n=1 Tax=Thalassospira australica TaxID=1528106 RepID=UPI00384E3BCE
MDEITTEIDSLNSEVIDYMTNWVDMLGGGEIGRYVVAGVVLLFVLVLKRVLAHGVIGGLRKLAHQRKHSTAAHVLDAFEAPVQLLVILGGVYFSVEILDLPENVDAVLFELIGIFATFSVFWALFRSIEPLAMPFNNLAGRFGGGLGDVLRQFFIRAARTLIVVIGVVVLLENWGIDVSAFLGGLGLAGMAVALAAKDSVANIFGGLTILADNRYKRGDWVTWRDIRNRHIIAFKHIVEANDAAFAFPSQSLYVETLPENMPDKSSGDRDETTRKIG